MDLGADFLVFVDNVAVLEHDVLDGNVDGEAFRNFGRVNHAGVGCGSVFLHGGSRVGLGEEIQDVAKVELVAVLRHVDVEALHIDFAYRGRLRKNLERVHVDAEFLERNKRRGAVLFHEGEGVDVHGERERIQAYVLDGDLSSDEFLGMGDDIVLDESRGELERREDEYDKGDNDDGDNLDSFLHA